MTRRYADARRQGGFTLIEAMMAIVVLTFGVLSLAGLFAQGIVITNMTQMDYIAQKKAEEAMESIFAVRDSKQQPWANIRNVQGASGIDNGIFLDLPQPLFGAGADGLYGTSDDSLTFPQVVIVGPGPDGQLGTADDDFLTLRGMTRTIAITDIPNEPNLRQITITMDYRVGHITRRYTLLSYVSEFS